MIKNIYFEGPINELAKVKELKLPMKEGFKLIKLMKELEQHHRIYLEAKKQLLERYGKVSEDKFIINNKDDAALLNKEFDELLMIEVEIKSNKISLPEELVIDMPLLAALEPFVL